MSNSFWPHGVYSPWNSPGQNTGLGSFSLLQGIFPTQGLNPGLLHCRWLLYQLSHQGNPRILEWVAYPFSSRSFRPRNWTRVSFIAGEFFTNWAVRSPFLYRHCFNTQEKCMFKKFKSGTLVSLTKFQKKRKKNLLTGIINTIIFQGEIGQRSKWAQVCIHILLPPLNNHLTLASHTASQVLVSLPLCEIFLLELSLNTEHFLSIL